MKPDVIWKHRPIWLAFWAINIGLMLEILLSLLPVGLLQTYQSISVGYWSARSPEFLQTDLMRTLRWMRMFGDTVFSVGAISFVYFALDLILRGGPRRCRYRAGVIAFYGRPFRTGSFANQHSRAFWNRLDYYH